MAADPRRIDRPEPGFFALRLVKGGMLVPCEIRYDEQTGRWTTITDGEEKSAIDPGDAGVWRIWLHGKQIEAWQAADMVARKVWAREHSPDDPSLHPRRRIDPMRLAPVPVPRSLLRRTEKD